MRRTPRTKESRVQSSLHVEKPRKGAIVILFALLLTVFLVLLALAIDIGFVANTRTEMQVAVDAGALAGAGALSDGAAEAEAAVVQYVQKNLVGNRMVDASNITIERGIWDEETRTFVPGGLFPSAIRVSARDEDQPMFFGRLMGHSGFDVSAEAIAVYQPRDILVVLDYSGSMNDDSELRHISQIGQGSVEANLAQIYNELGSPVFGLLQWTPQYIASDDVATIKTMLGLNSTPYPYPSGSWNDYINYVRTSSYINAAGYRKKYGYLTLVNYWLERQAAANQTPDLWRTSEQPITAVKDAVTVLLAYIQQVQAADRIGLAVYTHPTGGAKLETGLTPNMQLVEDLSRHRQAGHYEPWTNIGAGLQVARIELEDNARPGAFKMIVLMTDGQANRPDGYATEFVLDEARLCADDHFPVVTVSLGASADTQLMQQVADLTGGIHFNIPGGQSVAEYEQQLKDVFREIAANRPLKLVQ